ncbi:TPA: HNH endonuclease [Klebsiella pneumoniae]|nr:HNH endonuclease [Klebsiella pneumoniae]HDU1554482.1 HNH endonuclease [Klebsiella pneumoniae]
MQTLLKESFHYAEGQLIWKYRPASHFKSPHAWKSTNSRLAGKPAGRVTSEGYVSLCLNGKGQYAHRLIWIYHFGNIPAGMEIDHINHNRLDNRIENLRCVTRAENARNLGQRSTEKRNGVSWKESRKRWHAQITVGGKSLHIGYFTGLAEATAARIQAEKDHGVFRSTTNET